MVGALGAALLAGSYMGVAAADEESPPAPPTAEEIDALAAAYDAAIDAAVTKDPEDAETVRELTDEFISAVTGRESRADRRERQAEEAAAYELKVQQETAAQEEQQRQWDADRASERAAWAALLAPPAGSGDAGRSTAPAAAAAPAPAATPVATEALPHQVDVAVAADFDWEAAVREGEAEEAAEEAERSARREQRERDRAALLAPVEAPAPAEGEIVVE